MLRRPAISLTLHDDPNDDVPQKRGKDWAAISKVSCSGGRRTLGIPCAGQSGRVQWLPNFVKSVNSLTPVVSATMTIKANAERQSTLKEKRAPQGAAAPL